MQLYTSYNACIIIFIASNQCLTHDHLTLSYLFGFLALSQALFLMLFLIKIGVKYWFKCLTFIHSSSSASLWGG